MRVRAGCLLLLVLVFGAGCSSVQSHRARQHPEAIAALTSEDRDRVLAGSIAKGDSREEVYVALGTPEYAKRDEAGGRSHWIYFGSRAGEVSAAHPTLRFHTRSEFRLPAPGEKRERLTVTFEDGVVVSWEIGPIEPGDLRTRPIPYGRMPEESEG